MRLPDVFADVFVARDGDATTAGLEILAAVFTLILIVIAVVCWRRIRRLERRAAASRAEEEELGQVVGEIRHHIIASAPDSRPQLTVINGG